MAEPFQREKDIRAGKLDNEMPGFKEITGWIQRMPVTWLPAILMRVTKQCVIQKPNLFTDDHALLRLVDHAISEAKNEMAELRKPEEKS